MQAVRNTFTFATMGHGVGGGRGGDSRGERVRGGRIAVVGAVIYALWVFNMQHLESLPQFLLWQLQQAHCRCRCCSRCCPLPPATCHMPRCPNGKQIYALSSKNLYGMQVPQLVAGKRSKKNRQTKQSKNMFEKMLPVSISIPIAITMRP